MDTPAAEPTTQEINTAGVEDPNAQFEQKRTVISMKSQRSMLIKKTTTVLSEQIAKAKLEEDLDSKDKEEGDEDSEDDGTLYEKTAEEDEELREADWSTYKKILNESGGLWFWIPFSSLLVAKVFLWNFDSSFWTRFADCPAEE